MPLADITCKNAKPRTKPYKVADGDGMYLEVMPNGSRYWRLKYRVGGKEKRLVLGVYPEVTLAEARDKRADARKLLAAGIDPSVAKIERKYLTAQNTTNTFEAVAREWHQHNIEKWTSNYASDILRRLETDILGVIGKRPIADISPLLMLETLKKIEKRGAHEMSRRAMQYCSQIFRYAIVTGRAERNPTADLKDALKPVKHGHFAALEAKDLPAFLCALKHNDARLFNQTRLAIRLMMLTFVRTGELIKSEWKEFNLDSGEWHIPAERMKMRRPHVVPLSKQAVEVLHQLQGISSNRDYVFASVAKPRQHMSNNTILKALERLGYKGRMTGHGFRALAMSTIKEKLGYRHEVVDRQLAHAQRNKVDAAYDRAQFLSERKKMMQEWADYLDTMASESKIIVGNFKKLA